MSRAGRWFERVLPAVALGLGLLSLGVWAHAWYAANRAAAERAAAADARTALRTAWEELRSSPANTRSPVPAADLPESRWERLRWWQAWPARAAATGMALGPQARAAAGNEEGLDFSPAAREALAVALLEAGVARLDGLTREAGEARVTVTGAPGAVRRLLVALSQAEGLWTITALEARRVPAGVTASLALRETTPVSGGPLAVSPAPVYDRDRPWRQPPFTPVDWTWQPRERGYALRFPPTVIERAALAWRCERVGQRRYPVVFRGLAGDPEAPLITLEHRETGAWWRGYAGATWPGGGVRVEGVTRDDRGRLRVRVRDVETAAILDLGSDPVSAPRPFADLVAPARGARRTVSVGDVWSDEFGDWRVAVVVREPPAVHLTWTSTETAARRRFVLVPGATEAPAALPIDPDSPPLSVTPPVETAASPAPPSLRPED